MLSHNFVGLSTGVRMHYVEALPPSWTRNDETTTVVFVHGFPDSWYGWRNQVLPVANAGYRCIAPDNRGYGETTPVFKDIEAYAMEKLCQDYVALLDALLLDKVILVGHDWGGTLVWNFAMHFPERVLGVVGLCTPMFPANPNRNPWPKMLENPGRFDYQIYFQTQDAELEFEHDYERTVRCMIRGLLKQDELKYIKFDRLASDGVMRPTKIGGYMKVFDEDIPKSWMLTDRDVKMYAWQFSQTGFFGILSWYRNVEENWRWNNSTAGKKIHVPCLMICADQDHILPPSMTKHMAEWIPDLKIVIVEESGHWVAQEQPDKVNAHLIQWLQANFNRSRRSAL